MGLSMYDAEKLQNAGFTQFEIDLLARAKDPSNKDQPPVDLNSGTWKDTLQARREWVEKLTRLGWTKGEIDANILLHYQRDPKRSPWDFIKAEYKPRNKVDFVSYKIARNAKRQLYSTDFESKVKYKQPHDRYAQKGVSKDVRTAWDYIQDELNK